MLEFKIRLNNGMPLIDDLLLVLEDAGYESAFEAKHFIKGRNDLFLFFYSDGDFRFTYDEDEFKKRNFQEFTVKSAFAAMKLERKNFEDATYYVKRGTYVIHVLHINNSTKETDWYYYKGIKGEDGHWEPFRYNDQDFCKKFFGPKYTGNCLVSYKHGDIRKPNKSISRIKLNPKVQPFRPRTTFKGVVW
ncbi:hypothetical protein [Acinetobacter nosocomialis]|uniref:hypothetical protein n=1 Tax=Acinetobacter nosocomialis TaxID=106654 RepID=UPI0033B2577D